MSTKDEAMTVSPNGQQTDVSGSVTYQGVTYNWGDKVVSPNGYEFFVVTDDGRWGLVDHGGTFCELQHCDLTGYLHCH
jgi:hypothetical protein